MLNFCELNPDIYDETLYHDISAWWIRANSKFSGQEFEEIYRHFGSLETLKQVRIPPKHEVVIAMKSVRIVQYLASDAVR